jgi:hypothetical protein
MFLSFITHSPAPGILKGPQCIKRPNFALANHFLALRFSGEGVYVLCEKTELLMSRQKAKRTILFMRRYLFLKIRRAMEKLLFVYSKMILII